MPTPRSLLGATQTVLPGASTPQLPPHGCQVRGASRCREPSDAGTQQVRGASRCGEPVGAGSCQVLGASRCWEPAGAGTQQVRGPSRCREPKGAETCQVRRASRYDGLRCPTLSTIAWGRGGCAGLSSPDGHLSLQLVSFPGGFSRAWTAQETMQVMPMPSLQHGAWAWQARNAAAAHA